MANTFIILASLCLILSVISLMVGIAALSFVIGLKNSTHQVVWKPVEPEAVQEEEESFEVEEPVIENPNKRIKKTEESFADLDDPSVTSNNW